MLVLWIVPAAMAADAALLLLAGIVLLQLRRQGRLGPAAGSASHAGTCVPARLVSVAAVAGYAIRAGGATLELLLACTPREGWSRLHALLHGIDDDASAIAVPFDAQRREGNGDLLVADAEEPSHIDDGGGRFAVRPDQQVPN